MSDRVLLIDDRDGVRTLTLNGPERKNALDAHLWVEIADALRTTKRDHDVRALVITGAGGAFCSGADIGTGERIHPRCKLDRLTDVALAPQELSVPTVGKVTGVAVGAGWNLAVGCDLVAATPESRFCPIFSQRGLSVDLGGSYCFPSSSACRLAAGPPFAVAQSKAPLNDGAAATLQHALANEARAHPGTSRRRTRERRTPRSPRSAMRSSAGRGRCSL